RNQITISQDRQSQQACQQPARRCTQAIALFDPVHAPNSISVGTQTKPPVANTSRTLFVMDTQIDQIKTTFEMLPDWEERYRFIIGMGSDLEPLQDAERNEATRARGCMSQVWLVADPPSDNGIMHFRGDSDAHIVRGLIAILLTIYGDKSAR